MQDFFECNAQIGNVPHNINLNEDTAPVDAERSHSLEEDLKMVRNVGKMRMRGST